ncbi:c-type cytochrome [Pedobacter sp. HMF7647]|uniref:Photosynthetic reaction center cytochrome c subunit n=1 Tax=Hufsiella arboris TaxID=2695275 RepID=A0A7K1YBH2_9SPHI|nr:c-type cytochrome [Hufsiella arboris]MXV51449.1 c-type cytochrome [Hufsiella arboris]
MTIVKKLIVVPLVLAAFIFVAATFPQPQTKPEMPKPKNLKVLPKDISHEDLDKIMDGYKVALGVKCNFCHAQSQTDPKHLDFASDENKHKDIARAMMRMTAKINKKYFKDAEHKEGANLLSVDCITCHNGNKEPKNSNLSK